MDYAPDYLWFAATYGLNYQYTFVLTDLDGDFDVDDDDLVIFDGNLGMSNPTWADGDFNNMDGHVNAADLDLMFAQYGLELAVVSSAVASDFHKESCCTTCRRYRNCGVARL